VIEPIIDAQLKVVADSVAPDGSRLFSAQGRIRRPYLPELNTHRGLNKNSASSRAIPVEKQIQRILDDTAWPLAWPREQKGMQGGASLDGQDLEDAKTLYAQVFGHTIGKVEAYLAEHPEKENRLHKSVLSRLLEPFMWHTVLLTGTAWKNFFDLRCSALAQPEIEVFARAMQEAMEESQPVALDEGEWHLPYVRPEEQTQILAAGFDARQISAGRCARLSYLTQEGVRDFQADINLFETLASNGHWSPLEHVATPWPENRQTTALQWGQGLQGWTVDLRHLPKIGNLVGWRTLRVEEEVKNGVVTYR